jgi:hypothetical protein
MATTKAKAKSAQKLLPAGNRWHISWKRLVIVTSVTLNIGFVVIWLSLATTNSLDGLFMENGLVRYCSTSNDDKFDSTTAQTKGLRSYVCDKADAHQYFHDGLVKYYKAVGIPYATKE